MTQKTSLAVVNTRPRVRPASPCALKQRIARDPPSTCRSGSKLAVKRKKDGSACTGMVPPEDAMARYTNRSIVSSCPSAPKAANRRVTGERASRDSQCPRMM